MNVVIQSVHFKADQKLEDFIRAKVDKLESVFEHLVGSEVTLRLENVEDHINKIADIRLMIPGNDLFASKQAKTFEEAVDQAVDALKKQLLRYKEKIRSK